MPRRKESRIPDAVLDRLLAGADPQAVYDPNGLLDALKKALAERVLNAEMDHPLAGEEPGNRRNGYGKTTVMIDTGAAVDPICCICSKFAANPAPAAGFRCGYERYKPRPTPPRSCSACFIRAEIRQLDHPTRAMKPLTGAQAGAHGRRQSRSFPLIIFWPMALLHLTVSPEIFRA